MRTRRHRADRGIVGAIRLHGHGTPPGLLFPSDLARGAAGAASVFLSINCFVCECVAPATTPKPVVSQRGREVRGAFGSRQRRLSIRSCGHGNVAPTSADSGKGPSRQHGQFHTNAVGRMLGSWTTNSTEQKVYVRT